MLIDVVMPAYQAESTLRATVQRIPQDAWARIHRLHLVDDGCRDATARIASELASADSRIVVHRHAVNRGYGPAVLTGLAAARGGPCDVAVVLHADGQYPPERLLEFAGICRDRGLALLQGSRHRAGTARAGGMPLYKIVAGRLLVALENRVLGLELTDYHSGFLLHHRTALERIPYESLGPSFDFDLQVIACAAALGLRVGEEAIATRYADEVSHLKPIPYGLRVLRVLRDFRRGRFHELSGLRRSVGSIGKASDADSGRVEPDAGTPPRI